MKFLGEMSCEFVRYYILLFKILLVLKSDLTLEIWSSIFLFFLHDLVAVEGRNE